MVDKNIKKMKKRKADEFEDDFLDEEDLEDSDYLFKERRRSQTVVKEKRSRKRQDMLVVIIACIIIGATLVGYYYYIFTIYPSTVSEESALEPHSGNYTGELYIISDITHNWGKESWHLMDFNGDTNFMLKVDNTGAEDESYKLSHNNKVTRISLKFSKNNFKLKPGESTLVIIDLSTNIDYEYRAPQIKIDLKSPIINTVLGSVNINLTITRLDTALKAKTGDKVSAYYTGAFGNGTLFDHSLKDPDSTEPLHISLSDDIQMGGLDKIQYTTVILGFKKGIINMVPGETHVIIVPPNEGYPSDHDLGGLTLIFEVRLLSNDREF